MTTLRIPIVFALALLVTAACGVDGVISESSEGTGVPEAADEGITGRSAAFNTNDPFTPGSTVKVCKTNAGLYLRGGPSTFHQIITAMSPGTPAQVLTYSGGWYAIDVPNGDHTIDGWSHGFYLCLDQVGNNVPPSSQTLPGSGNLEMVTPRDGNTYTSPVDLRMRTSPDIVRVEYWADTTVKLGESSDRSSMFYVQYRFINMGWHEVIARGLAADGRTVAERAVRVEIVGSGSGGTTGGGCTSSFSHPASGYGVSNGGEFGDCRDGCSRKHAGIDLLTPNGTAIHAADGGRVSFAGWMKGYGYTVDIDHCGQYTTRYAHLSRIMVAAGQNNITKGQVIGRSGNSGGNYGYHLHFEIRSGGRWGDSQNPRNHISF